MNSAVRRIPQVLPVGMLLLAMSLVACDNGDSEPRQAGPTVPAATPASTATPPVSSVSTPQAFTETTRFEVNAGPPAAEGWKWVLGELKTGAEPVTNPDVDHGDPWLFYVIAGTTEISAASKKDLLTAGTAHWLPAGVVHGHLFAPQTRVLVLQLKNRPPSRAHNSDVLLVSETPLALKAGVAAQLRVREISLAPGASLPGRVAGESAVGYVLEGTLSSRIGSATRTFAAGEQFEWRSDVTHDATNGGTVPVRFVLFDVRQTTIP